jgi:mRNA interferase RelE/StbE
MNYQINYVEEVLKKDLSLIDLKQLKKIFIKIDKVLSSTPKEYGTAIKTLKGNLVGLFRLRVGDYRVIYRIFEENKEVLILKIGHRKDAYKSP